MYKRQTFYQKWKELNIQLLDIHTHTHTYINIIYREFFISFNKHNFCQIKTRKSLERCVKEPRIKYTEAAYLFLCTVVHHKCSYIFIYFPFFYIFSFGERHHHEFLRLFYWSYICSFSISLFFHTHTFTYTRQQLLYFHNIISNMSFVLLCLFTGVWLFDLRWEKNKMNLAIICDITRKKERNVILFNSGIRQKKRNTRWNRAKI